MRKIFVITENLRMLTNAEFGLMTNINTENREIRFIAIPEGLTINEMDKIYGETKENIIVFVHPVAPYLLGKLDYLAGYAADENCVAANATLMGSGTEVYIFHGEEIIKI